MLRDRTLFPIPLADPGTTEKTMGEALIQSFRAQLGEAAGWEPGRPLEPVLEALAGALALEVTGDLRRIAAADRDRLRKIGQRALLHVGAAEDEDELDAIRLSAALARDGLRALSGRPVPQADPVSAAPIAPEDLAQLVAGRMDGLAAGALAMRIRRDPRAQAELEVLLAIGAPEEAARVALAAADVAPLLDPSVGRPVGALSALGVEAVLFDGDPRRLAVYAAEPIALRLEATGLATEDARAGYWVGRIGDGVDRIEATLRAGERTERWTLVLA